MYSPGQLAASHVLSPLSPSLTLRADIVTKSASPSQDPTALDIAPGKQISVIISAHTSVFVCQQGYPGRGRGHR